MVNPLLLLALLGATAAFGDPQADSLRKCAESSGLGQTSGFRMKQTLRREGQAERRFLAECHLANQGEKLLVTFEDPADMAGFKLLFKEWGKQMWTYFPRTNRVRKMAGADANQPIGSMGFSYDDLFPFLDDSTYSTTVVGEETVGGIPCRILEIIHSARVSTRYKKARILVDEGHCRIVQSRFFGDNDRMLKTVHFLRYETVEGRTVPAEVKVTQPDLGEESHIRLLAIEFGKNYGPNYFSEITLKR